MPNVIWVKISILDVWGFLKDFVIFKFFESSGPLREETR